MILSCGEMYLWESDILKQFIVNPPSNREDIKEMKSDIKRLLEKRRHDISIKKLAERIIILQMFALLRVLRWGQDIVSCSS